ncbi:protein DEK-like isoform X2 [Anthonomus grandis grandis]|uniref:protein DEK-like isoform X2 n=1 Tax=Anthonomus grandis grandis TaxID=2921223 RepID=UPI002166B2A7|nr:protein DEK-like isoform X2 [Anthonomus grandis grandis]
MTFAMSTEGDSVKSALSEANDKSAAENHTDESSQDSMDAKEESDPKKPAENNVNSAGKDEKVQEESTEGEGESEHESETSEKKEDGENAEKKGGSKEENDTKNKKEDIEVKEEDKEAKSEEGDNKSAAEEEEEVKKTDDKPEKAVKKEKPKKEKKASKEKEEKSSNASEKDDEEEEDQEEEEEEEVEEEEEENKKGKKKKGVPLLDQPLETSGKRERKNVQRYDEPEAKKEPGKIEFEEGKGTKLGEIPRVEAAISRSRGDDLKFLHKFLFDQPGQKLTYKKNIRLFCGFGFENDSDEFKTKQENLKKQDMKSLKIMCEILDLGKTGNKDEISDRILEFLMEPKDSGKPVGTGRPKRASAVRANNRGTKIGYSSHDDYSSDEKQTSRARRDKGKRSNLKDDSSSDEEFKPPGESDASDEKPRSASKRKRGRPKKQGGSSEEDEVSISGASSDESEDAPSSKRRKSVTKNSRGRTAKTPSKKGRPARAAATPRSAKGKRGRKAKDVSSEEEEEEEEKAGNEGSSSEDEPLVKKKKGSEPPTDDEIKSFIKSVLEGANLEEITMKTVCQRVYDNYPDFDLTARKNFIKSTVKSLIST